MKKIIPMLTALTLIASLFLSATCSAQEYTVTKVQDLGNGVTVETVVTVEDALFRSYTRRASTKNTYKNNGTEIATVTLTATFGYDGSDAWVVSSSGSHTVESGWSYSGERISDSGGTATLTATIKSTKGLGQVPVDISLTCSKNGDIS